jgi:hypothetical protein
MIDIQSQVIPMSPKSDDPNSKHGSPKQDTPGRPKSSSSRQQTQPHQVTQTGSPEVDADDGGAAKDEGGAPEDDERVEYRDRPTDDGKHGDGHQEPNTGPP